MVAILATPSEIWTDIHALSKVFVDLEPVLLGAYGCCTVRKRVGGWTERESYQCPNPLSDLLTYYLEWLMLEDHQGLL